MGKRWRPSWLYPTVYVSGGGREVKALGLTQASQMRRLTRKIQAIEQAEVEAVKKTT